MQEKVLLLLERLVVAVEGLSGNSDRNSISLSNMDTNISYLVAEKRRSEVPDLPFTSNSDHTSKDTDHPTAISIDEQLTDIGNVNSGSSGEKNDNLVSGNEPEHVKDLPFGSTVINTHGADTFISKCFSNNGDVSTLVEPIKMELLEVNEINHSFNAGVIEPNNESSAWGSELSVQSPSSNSAGSYISIVGCQTMQGDFLEVVEPVTCITSQEESPSIDSASKRRRTDFPHDAVTPIAFSNTAIGVEVCVEEEPVLLPDKEAEPVNYIHRVLSQTVVGRGILHKKGKLDNAFRCKLAEAVIQAEYGVNTETTIHRDRFLELAKWTVELFPGEVSDTYYIPWEGKGTSTTGKFYDAYTKLNKLLRESKLRGSRSTPTAGSTSKQDFLTSLPSTTEQDDAQLRRALSFLKTLVEPWEQVKEYWELTSFYRLGLLRSEEGLKLDEYMAMFPILKQPGCHLLLEHDFRVLFKDVESSWVSKWPEFSRRLKKELVTCGLKEKDLDCETAILYHYPRVFFVVPVKISGHKPWRASRTDIQEGFLVHIRVASDFQKLLERMKDTLRSRGTQLQPFALIVGESLKNITSSYVVVNDIPIKVESPQRAVEVTFKLYHSLFCNYPVQSARLWVVLARAIFGIEEKSVSGDVCSPEVNRLVSVLKCQCL